MSRYSFDQNIHICSLCEKRIEYDQHYELEICDHIFHSSCLESYFLQYWFSCPVCNERLSQSEEEFFRNILNRHWHYQIRDYEANRRRRDYESEDSGYESND